MKTLLIFLVSLNCYANRLPDTRAGEDIEAEQIERAASNKSGNQNRESVKMHLTSEKSSKDETIYQRHSFLNIKNITPPKQLISYEGEFEASNSVMFCYHKSDIIASCYYRNGVEKGTIELDFCVGTGWNKMYEFLSCNKIEFKLRGKDDNPVKVKVEVKFKEDRFESFR